MNGYGSPNQITGAPSSSNPQAGGGLNGLLTARTPSRRMAERR